MADANYTINIDAQSSVKQLEQMERDLQQINDQLKNVDKNSKEFGVLTSKASALDSQIKTLNKSMQATASVSKSVEGATKTISTGFASMGGSL